MTTDTAAPSADPTMANELAELQALAAEKSPQENAADEQRAELADRNEERAVFYCGKIYPFVQAFGSRMKRPLLDQEEKQLTRALADVGVRIIPEHGTGPTNPWVNLLLVCVTIAAPRAFAEWNERRKAETPNTGGDGAAGSASSPAARAAGKSPDDDMLAAAREFDATKNKPH